MKQVLFLYRFNPYHNRVIKKYATTAEYIAAAGSYLSCEYPKNFAYRDGVSTMMRVKLDSITESPDYALILTDENNPVIESRWFVLDVDIQSGTVAQVDLRRDVIADHYDDVINAPCFIEKATLNESDPFIFNTENITVNKIKSGETLLKDASNCAWVVGYMAPNFTAGTATSQESQQASAVYSDASDFNTYFPYANYIKFPTNDQNLPTTPGAKEKVASGYRIRFTVTRTNYIGSNILDPYGWLMYTWKKGTYPNNDAVENYHTLSDMNDSRGVQYAPFKTDILGIWSSIANNRIKNDLVANLDQIELGLNTYYNISASAQFSTYNNKIIKVGNKYYKLNLFYEQENNTTEVYFGTADNNDFVSGLKAMSCWDSVDNVVASTKAIYAYMLYQNCYLEATEVNTGKISINVDPANSLECKSMPFKMFCIPYSTEKAISIRYGTALSYTTITMAQDLALTVAKAISTQYSSSGTLYDIQLLPYCPDQSIIVEDHTILMPKDAQKTTLVTDGDSNNIGAIYWCGNNTGTFDISHTINISDVKMESIADMYRISSPNWNGQFEFNAAKNGGISKFNVDFTYKPHSPYIHINPEFGRLYGEDYNDARGLICAGDFSLPQSSSAWNAYEIQNKNYQNQFQRDIESLELTQSIQMKQQTFAALTNIIGGGVAGAATGMMVGGLGGAAAGFTAGAALSGAGAAMDVKYQKQLNEEAIDYRRDQFGFQIENIKALPQNLTNVGGLTANNKLFPVLEYYTCTDEEKQAIKLKLQYNGMSVNRIGTIAAFLQPTESYIKGKIIRLTIDEDNHFIEAIANEIDKGVFIK